MNYIKVNKSNHPLNNCKQSERALIEFMRAVPRDYSRIMCFHKGRELSALSTLCPIFPLALFDDLILAQKNVIFVWNHLFAANLFGAFNK